MIALTADHPEGQARIMAFREGLAALGWIEGRTPPDRRVRRRAPTPKIGPAGAIHDL
jgi:hypothetical protein